jgi:hypothetical protein
MNPDQLEYQRMWRWANPEKRRTYELRRKYRDRREYHRQWRSQNRDAVRAYQIMRTKLVPQPCEVCGATKAHAHHENYSAPLDVRWLCPSHHRKEHLFKTI